MRNKKLLVFNFICVFGFMLVEWGLPTLLARMIDKGIAAGDRDYIWKMGAAMIAITIVGITMNILLGYFTSRITTNIVADIRDDLFEKVQGYSHTEYEKIGVSSLITRDIFSGLRPCTISYMVCAQKNRRRRTSDCRTASWRIWIYCGIYRPQTEHCRGKARLSLRPDRICQWS